MLFRYTIEHTIHVPDGSRLIDPEDDEQFAYCIELPNGERIAVDPYITRRSCAEEGYTVETIHEEDREVYGIEGALVDVEEVQDSDLVLGAAYSLYEETEDERLRTVM